MTCARISPLLALHAGGDLPPKQARDVERHLTGCPICATELASYRTAMNLARELARAGDRPRPEDFTDMVMAGVAGRPRPARATFLRAASHWAVAACFLAAAALTWQVASHHLATVRTARVQAARARIHALIERDRSLVDEARLERLSVRGPVPLAAWQPSGGAGIVAILHKPDPKGRPDLYSVDYLTSSGRIVYTGDPLRRQRINTLTMRAGSPDNIYIAEYLMPGSTTARRRAVLGTLIDTLRPHYNQGDML